MTADKWWGVLMIFIVLFFTINLKTQYTHQDSVNNMAIEIVANQKVIISNQASISLNQKFFIQSHAILGSNQQIILNNERLTKDELVRHITLLTNQLHK
jgi:hypothetical protein